MRHNTYYSHYHYYVGEEEIVIVTDQVAPEPAVTEATLVTSKVVDDSKSTGHFAPDGTRINPYDCWQALITGLVIIFLKVSLRMGVDPVPMGTA